MKYQGIFVGALFSSALLAACGGNHGVTSPTSFVPPGSRQSTAEPPARLSRSDGSINESILYAFKGGRDGAEPAGALTNVNGTLYGTTQIGGSTSICPNQAVGCGTVFNIETSGGGYHILHRFAVSGFWGITPLGNLTYAGGKLYGTTDWGGGKGVPHDGCNLNDGCGTVFSVEPSGDEFRTLFRFDGKDGGNVYPGVVPASGVLYGGTFGAGSSCIPRCGNIFSLGPNGRFKMLHVFGNGNDGFTVYYSLFAVKRTLYGTAVFGGSPSCNTPSAPGCGVVFRIDESGGGYRILRRFHGGTDGATPVNVIADNGVLYGTTNTGGGSGCGGGGCGTVFRLDASGGDYHVLYRFQGGSDGSFPISLLVDANGTLYGATNTGGGSGCGGGGCGTVFKVDTWGNGYGILHSFAGGSDGAAPDIGGPIDVNGTLYGTTEFGGGSGCGGNGCGTVYEVTP